MIYVDYSLSIDRIPMIFLVTNVSLSVIARLCYKSRISLAAVNRTRTRLSIQAQIFLII